MHPLVRDLYKRVLFVGKDYPTGLAHVKRTWKEALRNPENCPTWYTGECNEEELLRAVHRGRLAVKEMIGIIQIKKYRTMKQRYGSNDNDIREAMKKLESSACASDNQE
jgi:hypothetical protein